MPNTLEIELEKIDRITDVRDIKEVMRDHAYDDAARHEEIMSVLKPIADAFSTASGFKKTSMIIATSLVAFLTVIWLSLQIYFKAHGK